MWTYTLGPLLALLPARWRAAILPEAPVDLPRAALLSGILEAVGSLLGLGVWYLSSMRHTIGAQIDYWTQSPQIVRPDDHAIGFMALLVFLTHPLTWVLAYFLLEGLLRTFSTALAGEAPGTLPLVLLDRVAAGVLARSRAARVPLVADEVIRRDPWDLRVASCRSKPDWKHPLTIRYGEEFFQVIGETPVGTTPARPYVYQLRRLSRGEILRGVKSYDPHDVLRNTDEPGHFTAVFQGLRERYYALRLPLLRDEVRAREDSEGACLEIRSCRPKPEWGPGRLVHHEGQYYRVESGSRGSPPRPFVFRLRRLPAGVPGRTVLLYSPDEPFHPGR